MDTYIIVVFGKGQIKILQSHIPHLEKEGEMEFMGFFGTPMQRKDKLRCDRL
jgi:hypothetical protein